MKRVLVAGFLLFFVLVKAQNGSSSFKEGEFLKYKIHYGLLNAGFTSVEVREAQDENKLHAIGKGWTTGMVSFLFKVNDRYETYIDKETNRPSRFIRKINEGGYKKDKEILFDFKTHQAQVFDYKNDTVASFFIQNNVQDMLSSFYYLRSLDLKTLKENDSIDVNMFFDERMHNIKVLVLGRDVLKTDFGEINCIKIRPLVLEGRVFKDEENVTLWLSDDDNKIPIKIKASILVGSVKAELIEFKGLAHPFP